MAPPLSRARRALAITSSRRRHNAIALLLAAGLLAGSSAGCETKAPPSGSITTVQASAVASAAPLPEVSATARPAVKEADSAIVIGERQTFRSTVLGEDRTILVHTPASYKQGKAAYPVLYLLDGEEHFHHTTGITTFLSMVERAPELIVVGVSSGVGDERERDLTPTALKDKPGSGGGARFLTFLKDELQPRIEGAYRTEPYRILVGHSLGGLFALQVLSTAPDTFNAYVAMSPSLWWGDRVLVREAEASFARRPDLQAFLFLTVGNEPGRMVDDTSALAAMLKGKAPRGLHWQLEHLEREKHLTIPHRSTQDALEALFAGWEPPASLDTVKGVQAHYEALSKRFHFEVKIPEVVLNNFGYDHLEKRRDEAIAAFKLIVQLYPDSAGGYDSLGEAFENGGQLDLAKASYASAVRTATENADPGLAAMKVNLERVSQVKAK